MNFNRITQIANILYYNSDYMKYKIFTFGDKSWWSVVPVLSGRTTPMLPGAVHCLLACELLYAHHDSKPGAV